LFAGPPASGPPGKRPRSAGEPPGPPGPPGKRPRSAGAGEPLGRRALRGGFRGRGAAGPPASGPPGKRPRSAGAGEPPGRRALRGGFRVKRHSEFFPMACHDQGDAKRSFALHAVFLGKFLESFIEGHQ